MPSSDCNGTRRTEISLRRALSSMSARRGFLPPASIRTSCTRSMSCSSAEDTALMPAIQIPLLMRPPLLAFLVRPGFLFLFRFRQHQLEVDAPVLDARAHHHHPHRVAEAPAQSLALALERAAQGVEMIVVVR